MASPGSLWRIWSAVGSLCDFQRTERSGRAFPEEARRCEWKKAGNRQDSSLLFQNSRARQGVDVTDPRQWPHLAVLQPEESTALVAGCWNAANGNRRFLGPVRQVLPVRNYDRSKRFAPEGLAQDLTASRLHGRRPETDGQSYEPLIPATAAQLRPVTRGLRVGGDQGRELPDMLYRCGRSAGCDSWQQTVNGGS